MNPRTTLVLAVIAALLGAFVWIHEIEGEADRRAAADDEKRIFSGLDSADVEALSFETQDGVDARFERRAGRWELVSPVEGPGDAVALDAIAGALANLVREGQVESPEGLAQYGLGEDTRIVRFEVGGETKGIRIGRSTPVGGHLYVAPLGDDEVSYVATYRLNALNRNLADLRDRRVFGFEVGDVDSLRVAWPEAAVELERDAGGHWQMTSPAAVRADDEVVSDLLTNLSFLRVNSFLDEPDEAVEAAARERAIEWTWTLRAPASEDAQGDVAETTRTAWIGGSVGEDLLLSGPDGRLYTISPERLDDFERRVVSYRYKTLSEFEIGSPRRVEIEFAGEESGSTGVTVDLLEGGWSSEDAAVDSEAFTDLVRELAQLKAADIVAEEMGEAELSSLGLAPPRVRIRVDASIGSAPDEEVPPLAEIALGRWDEERGLFAQRVGVPTVYLLTGDEADRLPTSWEAFESDFVVSDEPGPGEAGEELDPGLLEVDPIGDVDLP
jgi:hypothetical protein